VRLAEIWPTGSQLRGAILKGHELMAKFNPVQFIEEVRSETSKVTWPTWKEVWITGLMVLIMVTIAAFFFLLADQLIGAVIKFILNLGR